MGRRDLGGILKYIFLTLFQFPSMHFFLETLKTTPQMVFSPQTTLKLRNVKISSYLCISRRQQKVRVCSWLGSKNSGDYRDYSVFFFSAPLWPLPSPSLSVIFLLSIMFYDAHSPKLCNYLFLIPGSWENLSPPFLSPSARLLHSDPEYRIVRHCYKGLIGSGGK